MLCLFGVLFNKEAGKKKINQNIPLPKNPNPLNTAKKKRAKKSWVSSQNITTTRILKVQIYFILLSWHPDDMTVIIFWSSVSIFHELLKILVKTTDV